MTKTYLITGACRGIGRGLSRLLISKGHRVFLLDSNEIELEHMKIQLPKWFPKPTSTATKSASPPSTEPQWECFLADLSKPDDIRSATDSAARFSNGHLDVLVNNAAFTANVLHSTKFDADEFLNLWHQSLTVNLTGSMLMSRACLPLLKRTPQRESGGSIIFMSSTRAYQSEINSESYATTKAGLLGLMQALSCSLANDNVKVNAILPGWINVEHECKDGDDSSARWEDGLSSDDQRWHFVGRVGKVEDIMRAVEFLSGDENGDGFVTGQEIVVDGGVTRRMVYPE